MLIAGINLDGIFGTLISIVIIKAGVEMLGSPISQLLGTGVIDVFMNALRKKLDMYADGYIKTIRGVGFIATDK